MAIRHEAGGLCALSFVLASLVVLLAAPVEAFELRGGVSLGGLVVGTVPRFAVSPHGALAWRGESGMRIAVDDLCSLLPGTDKLGFGMYNQTSIAVGYAWRDVELRLGPSFSVYSVPACGATLCGRVVGLAPGGHAHAEVYFGGAVGVSMSANVDWVGGRSLVLPGGLAAMIVAGPVVRWRSR